MLGDYSGVTLRCDNLRGCSDKQLAMHHSPSRRNAPFDVICLLVEECSMKPLRLLVIVLFGIACVQVAGAQETASGGAPVSANQPEPSIVAGVSGDAWIGLAGALIGAVIGIGAAAFTVHLTNKETNRRHTVAVDVARRTILAEVIVNRNNVRQDWQWVYESESPADVAPVNRAGMYPPPVVVTSAWDGQVPILSDAFTVEQILQLQQFYLGAKTLVAVRQAQHSLHLNDSHQRSLVEAFTVFRVYAESVKDFEIPESLRQYAPTGYQ
jgi:hypothetical protein